MLTNFPEKYPPPTSELIPYKPYRIPPAIHDGDPYYVTPENEWRDTPLPDPAGLMELQTIGPTFIIPFLPKGSEDDKDCRQIFESVPPHPRGKLPSSALIFAGNLLSDCPEYFHLRLPKVYHPRSYNLSDLTIMLVFTCCVPGTIVFAFDPCQEELYHILTKRETERYPCGRGDAYAAVGNHFYFVGGCYRNHDVEEAYQDAVDEANAVRELKLPEVFKLASTMVDDKYKKNLEVEAFNLRQGKWEEDKTCITKFNKPKHNPFVFTFDAKIYALAARKPHWDLGNRFPSFEFLDTAIIAAMEERRDSLETSRGSPSEEDSGGRSPMEENSSSGSHKEEGSSGGASKEEGSIGGSPKEEGSSTGSPITWSLLSPPPFIAEDDARYIFCKERKCLFVKVSDDDAHGRIGLLWKFDIVSEKWYNNTTEPSDFFYDPEDSEFLSSLTDVPTSHFEGCIVHNILFHFEDRRTNRKARLLVGHDLRGKKVIVRRWEIDLKNLLQGEGHGTLSIDCLSHIIDFKFCLVINYAPSYEWKVNFLCICIFELSLSDPKLEESMTRNRDDFYFIPTLLRRLYFQLPNQVRLTYHTKLEEGFF